VVGMPWASTRSPGTGLPPWANDAVLMNMAIAVAERAVFKKSIFEISG
jgi:hypothetical protein